MRVVFYLQFDYTSVGKRIQHYRTSLNKTQEELAEQADISKNYLSKLENAQARGRLDKYYSVAQALGVTVDMLMSIRITPKEVKITSFFSVFTISIHIITHLFFYVNSLL